MTSTDKPTLNEHEILGLIARGHHTGADLATVTGRAAEGCARTAASLVRKGWVTKDRVKGIVHYRATRAGEVTLRRERLAAIPHKQASEIRVVEVPARMGVMAHRNHLVTTACGEEMPTTLVTRTDAGVRCRRCRAAMSKENLGRDPGGTPPQG